jgi:hypothetical protein
LETEYTPKIYENNTVEHGFILEILDFGYFKFRFLEYLDFDALFSHALK